MGNDGSRSGPRPQSEPVCATCGRPVGTAIKRRKVLGVYVPVWGPGPCRNPLCEAHVDEAEEREGHDGRKGRKGRKGHAGRTGHGTPGAAESGAEPAPARSEDD